HVAVLHHDQIIERDERVNCWTVAEQRDFAAIRKAEVAWVGGDEFVFECRGAVPGDAGVFAGRGYVLTNLALLAERTVRPLLVMTRHGRRVIDVHQFVRTLIWEDKKFSQLNFARLISRLRVAGREQGRSSGRQNQNNGENDRQSLHGFYASY